MIDRVLKSCSADGGMLCKSIKVKIGARVHIAPVIGNIWVIMQFFNFPKEFLYKCTIQSIANLLLKDADRLFRNPNDKTISLYSRALARIRKGSTMGLAGYNEAFNDICITNNSQVKVKNMKAILSGGILYSKGVSSMNLPTELMTDTMAGLQTEA